MFCFAGDDECLKTLGKFFHQLFFFKLRWHMSHVPLVPELVPPAAQLCLWGQAALEQSPLTEDSKNKPEQNNKIKSNLECNT